MQTLKIQIDSGIPYAVKLVRKGESYGRDGCLTNQDDEPLVEFYDARNAGKKGFDPEGQFVNRYSRDTLLERPLTGLLLDGGNPEWTVPRNEMNLITAWLRTTALQDVVF